MTATVWGDAMFCSIADEPRGDDDVALHLQLQTNDYTVPGFHHLIKSIGAAPSSYSYLLHLLEHHPLLPAACAATNQIRWCCTIHLPAACAGASSTVASSYLLHVLEHHPLLPHPTCCICWSIIHCCLLHVLQLIKSAGAAPSSYLLHVLEHHPLLHHHLLEHHVLRHPARPARRSRSPHHARRHHRPRRHHPHSGGGGDRRPSLLRGGNLLRGSAIVVLQRGRRASLVAGEMEGECGYERMRK